MRKEDVPLITSRLSRKHRRCMKYRKWTTVTGFVFALITLFTAYFIVYTFELWPWRPVVDDWCNYEDVPERMVRPAADEMTIVTMFIDLGVFKNGEELLNYRSPYRYHRWMRTFGKMVNRVVAYIENDDDIHYFKKIRACLPPGLTKIIKVDRHELPAFKHLPRIKHIYSRPSYPKYHPMTVYPEYACAMNAKYDALTRSFESDYFKTSFFAWLDLGFFRFDHANYDLFKLLPPDNFNKESIGFSQVGPHNPAEPLDNIVKDKLVWISGAMVLGTKERMMNFTRDYQRAVSELLHKGLSNTDEQVVYAMYSDNMRKPRFINIQTYLCRVGQLGMNDPTSKYNCLGYLCKNEWEKRLPHLKQAPRTKSSRRISLKLK